MARITITTADIAAELAAITASDAPSDAKTCCELAVENGVAERTMRDWLKKLNAASRLRVHMVNRTAIDGRLSRVPAYTIKPAPKPSRKR